MFKLGTKLRKINKKLIVEYSGEKIILPADIQAKVDKYWDKLIRSGRKLTRGEGFHITDIIENNNSTRVVLALSDYAHYVYSRHIGLPSRYAFKNIHTSCLIETSDNVLILGVMGKETAIIGNVQCVGGGLDNEDIKGKKFDLRHNIIKELMEEAGIRASDKKVVKSLKLEYLKCSKCPSAIAAIFMLKLKIDAADFQKRYEKFEKDLKKKGTLPEFGRLIYVKKNKKDAEALIKKISQPDHYIKELLREMAKS